MQLAFTKPGFTYSTYICCRQQLNSLKTIITKLPLDTSSKMHYTQTISVHLWFFKFKETLSLTLCDKDLETLFWLEFSNYSLYVIHLAFLIAFHAGLTLWGRTLPGTSLPIYYKCFLKRLIQKHYYLVK